MRYNTKHTAALHDSVRTWLRGRERGTAVEKFSNLVSAVDNWIWGLPMIVLLLGTHLFMTVRTGFIQRKTSTGITSVAARRIRMLAGDVSQFQALTTALASTIGTGNIVGVGTAVFLGGPGAVLWCWLTGVFGIATKYAESLIAVKYRVQTKDGRMQGGAMYALERGLHMKWLGVVFAAFAMLGLLRHRLRHADQRNFRDHSGQQHRSTSRRLAIGIVFAASSRRWSFIGGIKSIAVVCERLVPLHGRHSMWWAALLSCASTMGF